MAIMRYRSHRMMCWLAMIIVLFVVLNRFTYDDRNEPSLELMMKMHSDRMVKTQSVEMIKTHPDQMVGTQSVEMVRTHPDQMVGTQSVEMVRTQPDEMVVTPSDEISYFAQKANYTWEDWKTIENKVYQPFGYRIAKLSKVLAVLEQIKPQGCEQIFDDWINVAQNSSTYDRPPEEIPIDMRNDYLLNNFVMHRSWYKDETQVHVKSWTAKEIQRLIRLKKPYTSYHTEGMDVDHATLKYPLNRMTGLVIGSHTPWVEAICLRNGAEKIYTIDYANGTCDHPKVEFINAFEMAKNWDQFIEKFDFAVSYSSIEHSGLGRYGDPIDPFADIREMQKVRCLVKPNGLLFFGVVVGYDAVVFNVHRVYGRIRLPMMFEGYRLVDIIRLGSSITEHELPMTHNSTEGIPQYLFVLRKL